MIKIEEYVDVVSSVYPLTEWQRKLLYDLLKRRDSVQIFIMPRKFGFSTIYSLALFYQILQGEIKMINLPKKFKDLPFDEVQNVLDNPKKYCITVGEMFALITYISEMEKMSDSSNRDKVINGLKKENKELKNEVSYLKEVINSMLGIRKQEHED